MPNAQDLALGIPGDEMQATPTLNLAQAPQQEAAQPAGLDLAKPVSAQRQFINTLSSGERFGTMLQEFGAALQGKPSPIQARMESERKNKLLQLAEGKAAVDAISNGLKYAQALPPGPQREKAVSLFAKTLPDNLRSEFVDLANDPVASENGAVFAEDPRSAATAHAICSQAGDYGECMKAFVKDPAKNKMLLQSIDRPILPDIQAKLESIASIPEVKDHISGMLAKGQYPSISTLRDSMKKLPPELQLTSNEMLTVQRNQDILPRFGIYTDDMVKKDIEGKGKEQAYTFHQGHIPQSGGKDIPVNVRTNRAGLAEAEIEGKWVPKPANVVIGAVKSPGMTVNMPSSSNVAQNPQTGEWGVFQIGKDGKAAFMPMLTEGGQPLKPSGAKGGPVDELIAEVLRKAAEEAKQKSAAEAGPTAKEGKPKGEPTYYKGEVAPAGIARAKRDKDGRWYVERAGTKRYVITVPAK